MHRYGDFRDLRVWQAAMDLVTQVYGVAVALPTAERFELSSQIRRAAISIPSNIAEGWGRRSRPEFVRFARVANGSLRELQTQLLLCRQLGFVDEGALERALSASDDVARKLTALERSMARQS